MQIITIVCDGCGLRYAGTKKNSLAFTLDRLGWKHGPQGTHFCPEDKCQQKLRKLTESIRKEAS